MSTTYPPTVVTRRDELVYLLGTTGKAAFDTRQILGRVPAKSLLGACPSVHRD